MEQYNILRYTNPTKIVERINNNVQLNHKLIYPLIKEHFPWMEIDKSTLLHKDMASLYKDAYMCVIGKGKYIYQVQYDNYIIPIFTTWIQDRIPVGIDSIYKIAYKYMYRPDIIQKISIGQIDNELYSDIQRIINMSEE